VTHSEREDTARGSPGRLRAAGCLDDKELEERARGITAVPLIFLWLAAVRFGGMLLRRGQG
jgi:hypothetical protein